MPEPAPARTGLSWSTDVWIFCVFGSLFPGQLPRPSSTGAGTQSSCNPIRHPGDPGTRPEPCASCCLI
jgi:hypothetical protein